VAARRRKENTPETRRKPATTPEARENEMISLATNLAEEQIRAGTASSQVITHFLKLGSTREKLEQARLDHENALLEVKKTQIESQQRIEELYVDAIKAMRSYAGDLQPSEGNEQDPDLL
jgi:phage-related minor tail protein